MLVEEKAVFSAKWLQINQKLIKFDEKSEPLLFETISRIHKTIKIFPTEGVEAIAFLKSKDSNTQKLILIANFRSHVGKYVLEFPAGLSEHDGGRFDAERELTEETGYKPEEKTFIETPDIASYYNPMYAKDGTKFYFFEVLEEKNTNKQQDLEINENIKVLQVDLDINLLSNIKKICLENDYLLLNEVWAFAQGYVLRRKLKL